MRLFTCVVLVAGLAQAAERPVVALLPPVSTDADLRGLAFLIEARAAELIEQTGRFSELHLKQVLAMADAEGLTADGLSAAANETRVLLGADVVVTLAIASDAKGITLTGSVITAKKTTPIKTTLPITWPEALTRGSEAIAKAVTGVVPKKARAQPESVSPEALRALSQCYAIVIQQPLGIDNPAVLDGETLDTAAGLCEKALAQDPNLRFASAVLALATAITGDADRATKALNALGSGDDDMVEPFTLARFWMVTRFQSNEAGLASLRDVLKQHPGELIAAGYLADTLGLLDQHVEAEAAWRNFLTLVPASPFAFGKLSRALARQNKHDDAIAAATKALTLAPKSRSARLELGSRQIDAGKLDEAIATLRGIESASAEMQLRLGWAYWLKGEVDEAAKLFQQALDAATRPAEWRTRGRAHYNLALVQAKRGKPDAARAALSASLLTGYKVRKVDPSLEQVAKALERAPVVDAGAAPRAALLPRESSLIPFDASGAPELTRKKETTPAGFVLYKF